MIDIAYAAEETVTAVTTVAEEADTVSAVASGAADFYHFLFESYTGLAVLVGVALLISVILGFFLEWRTRRVYKDRGPAAPGSSFFDDDDEDESEA